MIVQEKRNGARTRGYDGRWEKAAATFKSRNPHCLGCAAIGRQTPPELVDHVEPHKGDQRKFWNAAMWQPCCRWHHDVVKQRLERMFEAGECTVSDLWLNSALAIELSRKLPRRQEIGTDGWPASE